MNGAVDVYFFGASHTLTQTRGTVEEHDTVGVYLVQLHDGKHVFFPWTSVQRMILVEEI